MKIKIGGEDVEFTQSDVDVFNKLYEFAETGKIAEDLTGLALAKLICNGNVTATGALLTRLFIIDRVFLGALLLDFKFNLPQTETAHAE